MRDCTAPSAAALLDRIRPWVETSGVLLIDGRSGSGKTTLAAWLAGRLRARVLAMEDLYQGWAGLEEAGRLLGERILPALTAGRPASWRTWDWPRNRPGPVAWMRPGGLVIVEGCGAVTAESRRFADLAVALVVGDAVRRSRILVRDPAEALPGHRLWAVQERRMLARHPWPLVADLVLPGVVLPAISVPQDDGR